MNSILNNKLYLTTFIIVALTVFVSYSSGPGKIAGLTLTGAPGDSNLTCATSGCHSGGSFNTKGTIEVRDSDGMVVSEFTPEVTYDVTLSISTTGNPSRYGFQMIALSEDESAADNWGEFGSDIHKVTLLGRDYLEHDKPSSQNTFTTQWTAPEAGSGNVTFYYSVNAVNGNFNNTGDQANTSFTVLPEMTTSTNQLTLEAINIYPNPATTHINFSGNSNAYAYTIYDMKGKEIIDNKFTTHTDLDISDLQNGLYYIQFSKDGNVITKRFIKQ